MVFPIPTFRCSDAPALQFFEDPPSPSYGGQARTKKAEIGGGGWESNPPGTLLSPTAVLKTVSTTRSPYTSGTGPCAAGSMQRTVQVAIFKRPHNHRIGADSGEDFNLNQDGPGMGAQRNTVSGARLSQPQQIDPTEAFTLNSTVFLHRACCA